MQYINARQAAEAWGLTVRRVQDLCRSHAIDGAQRWGRDWMIPADTPRPADRRRKSSAQNIRPILQLPRQTAALIITDLYREPGSFPQVMESLRSRPEAGKLLLCQMAYCQGDVEQSYRLAMELLQGPCGHNLQIGCGLMLAMDAVVKGDIRLWQQAKRYIADAPCHNEGQYHARDFWLAAMDSEIRDTETFPDWFKRGCFDVLPADAYPAVRFYYLRYLSVLCHEFAVGHRGTPDSQAMMGMLPKIGEPLISQTRKMGSVVSEIYLRLICAEAYQNLGQREYAVEQLDKAIALALPDKLYMILAEYYQQLDFLIEQRLQAADKQAAATVKQLHKNYIAGWTKLHNAELGRRVSTELTTREREVAKHAAFGLSNKEIADRLHISVNTVKQSLRTAMDKTGVDRRQDLFHFL